MKKRNLTIVLLLILTVITAFTFAACRPGFIDNIEEGGVISDEGNTQGVSGTGTQTSASEQSSSENSSGKILIAFFSATGTTEKIADYIVEITGGTKFEIVPEIPYTAEDLNYNDNSSRTSKEKNDPSARPKISSTVNISDYDIVFLGYPIWHGQAPKILYTFTESYDFSGKTVIPFCTSASSGVGSSVTNLKKSATSAQWKDGKRFSSSDTKNNVKKWIDSLGLIKEEKVTSIKISVGTKSLDIILGDNSSAEALVERLKSGAITVSVDDYGDFEKVGSLGFSLPKNDEKITTKAGDVILYQGSSITFYYDVNTWTFTKLGYIPDMTREDMLEFFGGKGKVTVTLSLK